MRTESEIEPVCQVLSYGKCLPGPGNHNKAKIDNGKRRFSKRCRWRLSFLLSLMWLTSSSQASSFLLIYTETLTPCPSRRQTNKSGQVFSAGRSGRGGGCFLAPMEIVRLRHNQSSSVVSRKDKCGCGFVQSCPPQQSV